jgi:hypothetical protein
VTRIAPDADGLIKLGKSGALGHLLGAAEVLVPEAVYAEAVTDGKREMHEDAYELETALRDGGAKVVPQAEPGDPPMEERAEALLEGAPSLGAGERAALRVLLAREAGAVLTDDRVFANLLVREGMTALLPTAAIVLLAERGRMSAGEAAGALERIEGIVRRDAYEAAMEDLRRMSGTEEER